MSEAEAEAKNEDGQEYSRMRATRRYVPLEPVTAVLLEGDRYLGHGLVSNVSESGACLIANTMIEPEQRVRIQFNTHRTELFQTEARVVWSSEGMDPHSEIVGVMVGVQFLRGDASFGEKIHHILERGRFHEIGLPDTKDEQPVSVPLSTINR